MSNTTEKPGCARAAEMVTCLYGEASAKEAADFARHMNGCSECRSEFAMLTGVRESMSQWRSEVLGLNWRAAPSTLANPSSTMTATPRRRLSALAALGEFFEISPSWLRGATAMAAVLFCLLAVLFVARMLTPREQLYTQAEVNARVQSELAQSRKEIQPAPARPTSEVVQEVGSPNVPASITSAPKGQKTARTRAYLSRAEREELASDLRLKPTTDEEDITFLLEGGSN